MLPPTKNNVPLIRSKRFWFSIVVVGLVLGVLWWNLRGLSQDETPIVIAMGDLQKSNVVTFNGDDLPEAIHYLSPRLEGSPSRRAYVASLRRAATLRYVGLDDAVVQISSDWSRTFDSLSISLPPMLRADALLIRSSLAKENARILRWVATFDSQAYLAGLDDGRIMPLIQFDDNTSSDPFLSRLIRDSDAATPDLVSLQRLLKAWGRASEESDSSRKIDGFAVGAEGSRLAVEVITSAEQDLDLTWTQIGEADGLFWYGKLAQGAYFISSHPISLLTQLNRDGYVLVAQGIFIVRTQGHDAYPIHVRYRYDPTTRNWWLESFSRRSSVRLGQPMMF